MTEQQVDEEPEDDRKISLWPLSYVDAEEIYLMSKMGLLP